MQNMYDMHLQLKSRREVRENLSIPSQNLSQNKHSSPCDHIISQFYKYSYYSKHFLLLQTNIDIIQARERKIGQSGAKGWRNRFLHIENLKKILKGLCLCICHCILAGQVMFPHPSMSSTISSFWDWSIAHSVLQRCHEVREFCGGSFNTKKDRNE